LRNWDLFQVDGRTVTTKGATVHDGDRGTLDDQDFDCVVGLHA
jgi:hypothetical protein